MTTRKGWSEVSFYDINTFFLGKIHRGRVNRFNLKSVGICAFGLLVLYCSVSISRMTEIKRITITKKDAGTSVAIGVGDILLIELLGTPSTGFWWHFVTLDREYLELMKEETRDTTPKKIEGAPILGRWYLKARKGGNTTIRMAYYRPWEGINKARDRFWLNVQITTANR